MKPLNIGIIGLGGAGRAHATRFARNDSVGRVLAFDTRELTDVSVPVYRDLDRLLDSVDAVSICTPDDTHCDYIIKCLRAGVHVLVEKPMVTSADEAERVRTACEQQPDAVFAVHHQMRCVDAFQMARQFIREGRLGAISHIEANYWHDMRNRWTRFDNWRAQGKGQSVIFGGACHPIDLVLDLIDEPVVNHTTFVNKNAFEAWPGDFTAATTMLQFESGVTAKVHASFAAVYPQRNDLIVLGENGTLIDGVLYDGETFSDLNQYRQTWKGVRLRRGRIFKDAVLNPVAKLLSTIAARTPMFRSNPFSVYHHEHACRRLIDNFVSAITDQTEVIVGFEDGRRVVELCEQIEADAARSTNQTIKRIPLPKAA